MRIGKLWRGPNETVRPAHVRDGLAVYALGSDEPVLLMFYPYAATVAGDRTLTALVRGLRPWGGR